MSIIARVDVSKPNDVGFRLRVLNATNQRHDGAIINTNGDEELYKNNAVAPYAGSFSKTFEHNSDGSLTSDGKDNFKKLLYALKSGEDSDFSDIQLANGKLVDPQASLCIALDGVDSCTIPSLTPPALSSPQQMVEMLEDYAMEIARDVPFIDYSTDPTISALLNTGHLNSPSFLSNYSGPVSGGVITSANIFQGTNLPGGYISQLLYFPIPIPGFDLIEQKYLSPKTRAEGGLDFGVDLADMVYLQNGNVLPNNNSRFHSDKRYIYNGRTLAESVHNDVLFQFHYHAALILKYLGCPRNSGWNIAANQQPFSSFGGDADAFPNITAACGVAIKHAWYHKWQIHRRLRPEATSILINNQKNGVSGYNFMDATLMANDIITDIGTLHHTYYGKTNSFVLSSSFPEGCPAHPAYPAGHATVAGAGITMIKAYFDCSTKWVDLPNLTNYGSGSRLFKTAKTNVDGTALVAATDIPNMSINDELNKMAYNIALGRDWANVHYRTDGDMGMLLGEEVAINYIKDLLTQYNQTHTSATPVSITIQKIDGSSYTIFPTTV